MDRPRQTLVLGVAFLSGAAVMVLEFAAARLFAPWFGMSLPVWSNVIGLVLAALAIGSWLGGRLAARGAGMAAPGWALLLAGGLAVGAAYGGPLFARSLLPASTDLEGVVGLLQRGSLLATLVVFGPPMVLLGTVVPLSVHLIAPGREPGKAAGWVVGLSTTGSILGTFLATHHLLPQFGTRVTIVSSGGVLLVSGLSLVVAGRGRGLAAGVAAAAVLLVSATAYAHPFGPFRPAEGPVRILGESDSAYQFLQVREIYEAGADPQPVRTRILTMNEGVSTYHSVYKPGDRKSVV